MATSKLSVKIPRIHGCPGDFLSYSPADVKTQDDLFVFYHNKGRTSCPVNKTMFKLVCYDENDQIIFLPMGTPAGFRLCLPNVTIPSNEKKSLDDLFNTYVLRDSLMAWLFGTMCNKDDAWFREMFAIIDKTLQLHLRVPNWQDSKYLILLTVKLPYNTGLAHLEKKNLLKSDTTPPVTLTRPMLQELYTQALIRCTDYMSFKATVNYEGKPQRLPYVIATKDILLLQRLGYLSTISVREIMRLV
jgi:hypothetical protein